MKRFIFLLAFATLLAHGTVRAQDPAGSKDTATITKLLEERQNELKKEVTALEEKVAKQQEIIERLQRELAQATAAARATRGSSSVSEPLKPVAPLPTPGGKPAPEATPTPSPSAT
jgi:mannose-1-phosphate guanylyltransferase